MLFFTSDTHFYDPEIIKKYGRKFAAIETMNSTLIENWNSVVSAKDEIYILGDFLIGGNGSKANKILDQLNGFKYLIRGNHDEYVEDDNFYKAIFRWVKDYHVLVINGIKFILFHFPLFEWDTGHFFLRQHTPLRPYPYWLDSIALYPYQVLQKMKTVEVSSILTLCGI